MNAERIRQCKCIAELFDGMDSEEAKKHYFSLMRTFHPDYGGIDADMDTAAVINTLYMKLRRTPCTTPHSLYHPYDGLPLYSFESLLDYEHEYGKEYLTESQCIYCLTPDNDDFFADYTAKFPFLFARHDDADMQKESEWFFPQIEHILQTQDGIAVLQKRPSDEIPLSEAIAFYGGKLDSRHAAWVTSRLQALCCYAYYHGFAWNCLTEENLYINPVQHTLRIGGGWWFASEIGKKMTGVQSSVYECLPMTSKTSGFADEMTDMECVKAICRRMFPADAPKPMREYAESVCSRNAIEEFAAWDRTLTDSFGSRTFVRMYLSLRDILKYSI